ncbi:MAG: hypothetical protein HQK72_04585 [Desulfamplus sp.]|nr:hypothetical protein [Desulfamplus sp.]
MTTTADAVQSVELTKAKDGNMLANKCASTGMVGSLGATVLSGISQGKVAHLIHPWAGIAFVGFALWHTYLKSKEK